MPEVDKVKSIRADDFFLQYLRLEKALPGGSELEVHVAEEVLHAHDVREDALLAPPGHQAHGDPTRHLRQRDTGV